MNDFKYGAVIGLLIFIAVGLIAGVIAVSVTDCNDRKRCEAEGGHVVEYNCRTLIQCVTVNKITTCTPSRVCDWRCDGRPAPAPPANVVELPTRCESAFERTTERCATPVWRP